MRINDHRGEVITIVLATLLGVFIVATQIPVVGRIFGGSGSASVKAPAEEAWKEQTKTTEPVTIGVTATGEKVVAFREKETFRSGASKTAGKLTYGERIGEFFSGLTIWAIVGLALAFFVLGITPGMIFAKLRKRAEIAFENERVEKEKIKQALKNTVTGLQAVDDDTWRAKIKPLLEASQDKQDRDIIKDIKKEIDK